MSTESRLLQFRPVRTFGSKIRQRVQDAINGAITLGVLVLFGTLGALLKNRFDLVLPGTVIGLIAIAATLVALEAALPRVFMRLHESGEPTSRLLLKHLGLLFVPAGVGIVDEASALRQSGLALGVGVFCSTLVGVAVTYVTMRRLVRSAQRRSGAHTAC